MLLRAWTIVAISTLSLAIPTPSSHSASAPDNAQGVIEGLSKVANATIALNQTVASYPGGVAGTLDALTILGDSLSLVADINSVTALAKQSVNFTSTESEEVAVAFIDLLPSVESSLTTIDEKKADFETGLLGIGSLTPLVLGLVKQIKSSADDLGAAITAKLTAEWAAEAPTILAEVNAAFDTTIEDYS